MGAVNFAINLIMFLSVDRVWGDSYGFLPDDFSFGTGTSAYQTEGAWNVDGKSENIWDRWIHEDPSRIRNNDTADEACKSYYDPLYNIYYASKLGVQHYRFSISWSRLLPTGFVDDINENAVKYYQEILDLLEIYSITPVVTLYYHDLPQSLQDIGGWANPKMAKYFAEYAGICFQAFPNVEYWITFNDPWATCRKGYGEGTFAPGIKSDGIDDYLCAYTILKAHAAAYHLYQEIYSKLNGKISISLDMKWSEPATEKDEVAVERRNAFEFGLYANPIYKGNWPQEVIDRVGYRSINENFPKSRLPQFTEEEITYINGTSDFMAINMYYAHVVEDIEEAEFGEPSYINDMKVNLSMRSNWTLAENGQPADADSFRKTLVWLSSNYNNPAIFITENGIPDDEDNDYLKYNYIVLSIMGIVKAIDEDKVTVIGYTAWSLIDSFEWTDGYSYKFGLYSVDFDSPNRTINARTSAGIYNVLIETLLSNTTTSTTSSRPPTSAPGSASNIVLYPVFILNLLLLQLLF